MKTTLSPTLTRAIALGLLFTPALAQAHPAHSTGLAAGATHPFSGIDHLAAMLAVGLWAAQLGGRARFLVPLAFSGAMAIGGALAVSGLVLPGVEQGIAASVFVLGLLVAVARRLPTAVAMALTGGFALFHGLAHGSEMPNGGSAAAYAFGFIASTAGLQAIGLGLGTMAMQATRPDWIRLAGAAIVVAALLGATVQL